MNCSSALKSSLTATRSGYLLPLTGGLVGVALLGVDVVGGTGVMVVVVVVGAGVGSLAHWAAFSKVAALQLLQLLKGSLP